MPELPEVETIRRVLIKGKEGIPSIIGQTVQGASLFWPKTLATANLEQLNEELQGQIVKDAIRRGKYLALSTGQAYLAVHLRMSGDLRMEAGLGSPRDENPTLPHDRFYLHFQSGYALAFNDTRKFGRVWYLPSLEDLFDKLGLDPFDPSLDPSSFHQMLQRFDRQIKPLLLDQSFLAGVGNIYSDEALFASGIHPKRSSRTLSEQDAARLLEKIRAVLNEGLANNGSSIDWVYRGGEFQNHFRVFMRKGQPCPVCGTTIEKISLGQRGTHFCPHCQALEEKGS